MGIQDMIVGNRYLYGDSIGYYIGVCQRIDSNYNYCGSNGYAVWMKEEKNDCDSPPSEDEVLLFEIHGGSMFSTYVEPR